VEFVKRFFVGGSWVWLLVEMKKRFLLVIEKRFLSFNGLFWRFVDCWATGWGSDIFKAGILYGIMKAKKHKKKGLVVTAKEHAKWHKKNGSCGNRKEHSACMKKHGIVVRR